MSGTPSRPRSTLRRLTTTLAVAALAASLSSCGTAGAHNGALARDGIKKEAPMKTGVSQMLEEIYASRKPVRFEQLDVSDVVLRHIPLGTDKAAVTRLFAASDSSRIVEDSADKLVVRDNKGQAMLDPDARSVVMTFSFDPAGKLAKVAAVHLKNQ